ncbi:cobalt ECF transporter T component CbiQ [Hippea alviniae]|uniref:cobalt ECF transporter T component CbiQ n=1 Tax=Hippea alviniae TaxID=1279027 RepID=UPI0003B38EEA|nr:cobalt ECF transporter T component CbiQ [Hippea alviniae]
MKATQRTLFELSEATEKIIFETEFLLKDGFLQRVEPKIKLIGTVVILISISLVKSLLLLAAFLFLSISVSYASKIPLPLFLKRFLFIPLFSAIIAIPSIFSFVTPGDVLIHILGLNITKQGLETALMLTLRVSASVGITILLTLTTKWTKLIAALRSLAVSWNAILTLLIGYRYIFNLVKMVESNYFAKLSREIKPSLKDEYRFLGNKTGAFMQKSIQLSDNIYMAFLSRGYTNKTSELFKEKTSIKKEDIIWILISVFSFALVILWNMYLP